MKVFFICLGFVDFFLAVMRMQPLEKLPVPTGTFTRFHEPVERDLEFYERTITSERSKMQQKLKPSATWRMSQYHHKFGRSRNLHGEFVTAKPAPSFRSDFYFCKNSFDKRKPPLAILVCASVCH